MARKPDDRSTDMNKSDHDDKQEKLSPELSPELSEELFEQYLDGNSPVSAAYRELEQAEPPSAIDRAILGEARNAIRPRGKSLLDLDLRFWRHWGKPLSTAVIMGVCLTVVLRIMDYDSLSPAPPIDAEFASAEQKSIRSAQPESSGPSAADRLLANSPSAAARYSSGMAKPERPESGLAAQMARQKSIDSSREQLKEEITVTARKRAESPQEVPLAVTGMQIEEIQVAPLELLERSRSIDRADGALEAWQEGARPAADVWLAGINAIYAENELSNAADGEYANSQRELAKRAQVYPKIVQLSETADLPSEIEADSDTDTLRSYAAQSAIEKEDTGLTIADGLADPYVWAAGIEWLYENDRDYEAAAELKKFRQIYPQFEID